MDFVRRVCVVGAIWLCLAPAAVGQEAGAGSAAAGVAPYQRVAEERDGAVVKLEMAVREFAPPKEGLPKVYLAGAVHIGERSFYEGLQRFLDAQDVVLFEGVKPPGAGAAEQDVGGGTDEERAAATKRRVRFIAMAVEQYREGHEGKLPAGLKELGDGSEARIASLLRSSLVDSWGHAFVYTAMEIVDGDGGVKAAASFDIASLGADGTEGGEGVNADIRYSDQKPLSKPEKGDRSEGLQSKLASSMGLVFQLDAMDHNKRNWRNSDLSVDQVQARMEKAGLNADGLFGMLDGSSMFARVGSFLLGFMGSTPDGRAMLRVMIIEMIGHADKLLDNMPGGMGKVMGVLLEDRNAVVLADLKKLIESEPSVKSVGIIYGAGHLPGMERRLVEDLGYKPVGDTWRAAITVDAKEAGVTAAQLRATRGMISRMVEAQVPRKRVK